MQSGFGLQSFCCFADGIFGYVGMKNRLLQNAVRFCRFVFSSVRVLRHTAKCIVLCRCLTSLLTAQPKMQTFCKTQLASQKFTFASPRNQKHQKRNLQIICEQSAKKSAIQIPKLKTSANMILLKHTLRGCEIPIQLADHWNPTTTFQEEPQYGYMCQC